MSTQSKTTYWLDLGDLGEDVEAEVVFNWYKARVKAEDDYDELEVESVTVVLDGIRLNVVDMLGKTALELITEHCWERAEMEDGDAIIGGISQWRSWHSASVR